MKPKNYAWPTKKNCQSTNIINFQTYEVEVLLLKKYIFIRNVYLFPKK